MHQADNRKMVYIAGGPGGDSIGPAIHDYIAASLGLDWTCEFLRFEDVNDVMTLFHRSDFAGGIVTMPHKRTIIPFLNSVDIIVEEIGACNLVVRQSDGKLHGTNCDWSGIRNALRAESAGPLLAANETAMIYGAGGASRAAIYALAAGFGCETIYIVNRDEAEVEELVTDLHAYTKTMKPQLTYLASVEQAAKLPCPRYIISTVPDFEPKSDAEISCRHVLDHFLTRAQGQDNVLLDMCYHPTITRNLQAGKEAGWKVIPGYVVVGHQFAQQWNAWTGQSIDDKKVLTMCEKLIDERDAPQIPTAA